MAAIEHSKQVELQSPHLILVRTLQAVWMLLNISEGTAEA